MPDPRNPGVRYLGYLSDEEKFVGGSERPLCAGASPPGSCLGVEIGRRVYRPGSSIRTLGARG